MQKIRESELIRDANTFYGRRPPARKRPRCIRSGRDVDSMAIVLAVSTAHLVQERDA